MTPELFEQLLEEEESTTLDFKEAAFVLTNQQGTDAHHGLSNLPAQWGQIYLLDFRIHKHMCLFRRAIPSDNFAGNVQSLDRSRVQTEVQVYFA